MYQSPLVCIRIALSRWLSTSRAFAICQESQRLWSESAGVNPRPKACEDVEVCTRQSDLLRMHSRAQHLSAKVPAVPNTVVPFSDLKSKDSSSYPGSRQRAPSTRSSSACTRASTSGCAASAHNAAAAVLAVVSCPAPMMSCTSCTCALRLHTWKQHLKASQKLIGKHHWKRDSAADGGVNETPMSSCVHTGQPCACAEDSAPPNQAMLQRRQNCVRLYVHRCCCSPRVSWTLFQGLTLRQQPRLLHLLH